jgi:hypothetical protein
MSILITDLLQPADECAATLQDAMALLMARYPEAVFSATDFDQEPRIWMWETNTASMQADTAQAIAWLRAATPSEQEPTHA